MVTLLSSALRLPWRRSRRGRIRRTGPLKELRLSLERMTTDKALFQRKRKKNPSPSKMGAHFFFGCEQQAAIIALGSTECADAIFLHLD